MWRYILVVAAGCSAQPAPAPDVAPVARCPIGDPTQPAQLEIIHLDTAFQVVTTTPDGVVPLVQPPQGGWIAMLGARATNIDGCRVDLTTSFRDTASGPVIKVDRRPTTLDDAGDGFGVTSAIGIGNLPFCPQLTAARDLHDQPYVVTVSLDDAYGQHAEQSLTIIPVCPDPDPTGRCLCECSKDYVVGGACP
jgi:hypothetical protein